MKHSHDSDVCFSAGEDDSEYIAHFSISGSYSRATYENPAEYPEAELCCIERDAPGKQDPIPEAEWLALGIDEKTLNKIQEEALENAPDPSDDGDRAYDAWKDSQLDKS